MLKPTDIETIRGKDSRYAVVVGVAKRARDIADAAEAGGEILIEKPVSLAIGDFKNGEDVYKRQVRYLLDDRELCRIPLLTTDGVEARPVATYGERFIRYLKGLLAGFAG